jgi:hypothetical protein
MALGQSSVPCPALLRQPALADAAHPDIVARLLTTEHDSKG